MSLFFQDAIAAVGTDANQAAGGSGLAFNLIFIAAIFVVFYLLLWRPQSKRAKEHRDLVSSIAVGDEIMTNGGFLGKVDRVSDAYVLVNLAEGVNVYMQKNAITRVLPKGTIKSLF
jgi:preprotein translocase subunit YajC